MKSLNSSDDPSKVANPHKNVHKNLHSVDKILSTLFVHQIAQFVDKPLLTKQFLHQTAHSVDKALLKE